jgi:hypothetical protein
VKISQKRLAVFSPSETIWAHARSASIGTRAVIDGCLRRQRRQNRHDGPKQQDTNNHELTFIVHVVDGIIAREADPQAGRKTGTCRCGKREMKQWLAIGLDLVDEPRCGRLRGFGRNVKPDFGEVGFGCVGQAEGERSDSSFLPRAMILSASKSFTRPAATSANPLSISILSAASSSI